MLVLVSKAYGSVIVDAKDEALFSVWGEVAQFAEIVVSHDGVGGLKEFVLFLLLIFLESRLLIKPWISAILELGLKSVLILFETHRTF